MYDITYKNALEDFYALQVKYYYWQGKNADMFACNFEDMVILRNKYISLHKKFEALAERFAWCKRNKPGTYCQVYTKVEKYFWQREMNEPEKQEQECKEIIEDLRTRIATTLECSFERFPMSDEIKASTHELALYERYKKLMSE